MNMSEFSVLAYQFTEVTAGTIESPDGEFDILRAWICGKRGDLSDVVIIQSYDSCKHGDGKGAFFFIELTDLKEIIRRVESCLNRLN